LACRMASMGFPSILTPLRSGMNAMLSTVTISSDRTNPAETAQPSSTRQPLLTGPTNRVLKASG
jgi:hypothetical protein